MASPVGNDPDRARRGGRGRQLIGRDTAAFWQIVTAIGLTVTPLLARLGRVAARRVEPASAGETDDRSRRRSRARW